MVPPPVVGGVEETTMRLTLVAVAATAALGLAMSNDTGFASGKSFMGKEAPAIQVGDWINGDGLTEVEDYRGEVVLLEFWKTH